MLVEYMFVYLMIDVFCLAFSLVIFTKLTIDIGSEREVRALRAFIIFYALFLVVDAVWAMGTYDTWLMTDAASGILEAVTLLLMGFVSLCWFLFVEFRLNAPYVNSRWFVPVACIPMAVIVVLYATTRFTGLIYTVGPNATFANGPLAIVSMVLFLLYVAYATLHALVEFFRSKSSLRRSMCLTMALFAIPPVACGILDLFMHGMPIMALSTFASLLLVFMNTQNSRIYTDALTGLNNRRRAVEYIEDALSSASDDTPLAVFLIDVDDFKRINDERGHGEGDHALQLIAEGLRRVMDGHHGLAARWGGDEFLVAAIAKQKVDSADIQKSIQSEIDGACQRGNAGYAISVSVGYALITHEMALSDIIAIADKGLYKQKSEHHAASRG